VTNRRDIRKMGNKIFRFLKGKDAGSIGIGAMIIFIAMVLVAGIAASVLIQTSTRLESQALRTGESTIGEVASGILIQAIDGHNSSGAIDRIAIEIVPRAGSPDIDLSETVIEISDSNNKYLIEYGDALTNFSEINGTIFSDDVDSDAWTGAGATTFGIIVLQDADGSCKEATPVVNFGDHVILAVNTNTVFGASIEPRIDVFGSVIPEEGSIGVIGFTVPASITNAIVELQ
jgi:flagellin FlaB